MAQLAPYDVMSALHMEPLCPLEHRALKQHPGMAVVNPEGKLRIEQVVLCIHVEPDFCGFIRVKRVSLGTRGLMHGDPFDHEITTPNTPGHRPPLRLLILDPIEIGANRFLQVSVAMDSPIEEQHAVSADGLHGLEIVGDE